MDREGRPTRPHRPSLIGDDATQPTGLALDRLGTLEEERHERPLRPPDPVLRAAKDKIALEQAKIVLLGTGGNGIHVVQQLAYAGVTGGRSSSSTSSRTPASTAWSARPPTTRRPEDRHRDPHREVDAPRGRARPSSAASSATPTSATTSVPQLADADLVIGCFDKETPRQEAVKLCSEAGIPYLDLATEILPATAASLLYGGRLVFSFDGTGCLVCLGIIDPAELAREQMNDAQRAERDRIYGLTPEQPGGSGPSVVTINGVVASLACTEALMFLTGLREPARQLTYLGQTSSVVRKNTTPGLADCLYCHRWRQHPIDPAGILWTVWASASRTKIV